MGRIMKKCIIMGNGPSIADMPQELLWKMDSFGVNYCPYLPIYYVCVDRDILINHHEDIYNIAALVEIAYLAEKENGTSDLYELPNVQLVTHDKAAFAAERFFSGFTVVYVALKMAYYLGYEEVHLWGVDHSQDWSHYKDDYPRGDVAGRKARMAEMEYHYKLAANVYKAAGRRIINHSHQSSLDMIFDRQKGE